MEDTMSMTKDELLSRPSIAVDMDHVMADTGAYLCDWVNLNFGTAYEGESFVSLLDLLPKAEAQLMTNHVADGALMRDLPLFPGCRDVLHDLSESFAITVCTAAMEFPKTIPPKIEWLEAYFPFLEPQLFVFCGYKQIIGTDYLIDDSPKHFKGFRGTPLLFDAAHNMQEGAYHRVSNWEDIAGYFADL